MKKIIYSGLLFAILCLFTDCKKEEAPVTPETTDIQQHVDPVLEAQNTFSQLFSVAVYGQAAFQSQLFLNTPPPCGTSSFPTNNSGGSSIEIVFNDCVLATGLKVDGTVRFEVFGSDSPSTNPTAGNPVNTKLFFNTITINDRVIQNLSPGSFIEFRDIADPAAGYDLFEVFTPQTFRVQHTSNSNYTDYLPFETLNIPQENQVHLKLKIEPSISVDFTNNTPAEFWDDLYNKEFTLKVEKRPVGFTDNGFVEDNFWRARTYTSSGSSVQNLQLLTQSDASTPLDDIDGLRFSLQCGYFKGGTLITNKEIAGVGCYYPFATYDFGYNMMSGDMEGDAIDCNTTTTTEGDCDIWAIRKSYGDCPVASCTICNDLTPSNRPLTCDIVKCFGVE